MNEKIVIENGNYWRCENLDNLAPITEEGVVLLLDNGTREFISENENVNLKNYRKATEEEYKHFYHKNGHIFKNDNVLIVSGRKIPKGTIKKVKDFYTYNIPGTFGHAFTDYIVFDDDTKTNIQNVRVLGYENVTYVTEFKPINISGRI